MQVGAGRAQMQDLAEYPQGAWELARIITFAQSMAVAKDGNNGSAQICTYRRRVSCPRSTCWLSGLAGFTAS